jgi:hypothetical protein
MYRIAVEQNNTLLFGNNNNNNNNNERFLVFYAPSAGGFKGVAKGASATSLGLSYLFYKATYYSILIIIIKYRQWSSMNMVLILYIFFL